ncbi:MAG: replication-associated recombination protein A [Acidimicrobiia bacterium]
MAEGDLFGVARDEHRRVHAPLPERMRPRTVDEVIGQRHLLAHGAAFRSMVESGRLGSLILWGPPGSGKTTLARVVATHVGGFFEQISATSAGVKDVREILARADQRLGEGRGPTVLFLDEIHRFTKAQQDALLHGVEDGTVTLIGATTENPFFEVNSPLISRATVFRTEALTPSEIADLIDAAFADEMRGVSGISITDEATNEIAQRVGGDARLALNTVELAATIASGRSSGAIIDVAVVEEALQRRIIRYDRAGDRHYDVISAFIKSVRGSDPDAALYWLETMVAAGEDPKFIARRMVILASEDVGLADTSALGIAIAAFRAVEVIGLPEANFALSHAALYLALAPKSDSVKTAMMAAADLVASDASGEVPFHLRSATTAGERSFGYGSGYRYPHDDARAVIAQAYLPDTVADATLYHPKRLGDEAEIADRLVHIDRILGKQDRRSPPGSPSS